MTHLRRLLVLGVVASVWGAAGTARADGIDGAAAHQSALQEVDRTWLHLDDPRISPPVMAVEGTRLQLLPSSIERTHLVASGGWLHEGWNEAPAAGEGAWAQLTLTHDAGRVRIGSTVHAEHVFAPGRDDLDVVVQLSASYRVARSFRLGAEYVGRDLEELVADGADAGAKHYIGPTASVDLLRERVTLVAGPALGLSDFGPSVLGRVALSCGF